MSDFVIGLMGNYGQFFDGAVLWGVVTDPVNWAIVGSLVLLEGLLSADNAIVLAVMVKHLPPKQQKKALFYGIMGAYLFRFLAIGLGTYLIKLTVVKVAGALYLLWLSYKYFFNGGDEEDDAKGIKAGFWRTVLTVELMDIAFSMDSVLAAFGVSDQVWVLFLGGILGVSMMRGVAQIFLMVIEKYPELETTAYILIAIIGAKMMGSAFSFHLPDVVFFGTLLSVFLGTFALHHARPYLKQVRVSDKDK